MRGDFIRALSSVRDAKQWISQYSVDKGWFIQQLIVGECGQLYIFGDLVALDRVTTVGIAELERYGSDFLRDQVYLHRHIIYLSKDRPDFDVFSRINGIRKREPWTSVMSLWVELHALLYRADYEGAWTLWERQRDTVVHDQSTKVPPWNAGVAWIEATVALGCCRGKLREPFSGVISRSIKRLAGQPSALAAAFADLLRAGVAHLAHDTVRSERLYDSAAQRFEALSMLGHASAARVRQLELNEAANDQHPCARVNEWFRAQGVVDPSRWTRMYAPIEKTMSESLREGNRNPSR